MEIIISKNKNHISIHVVCDDEKSLSWEQLQSIKDRFFPDKTFIEVYPPKDEIINKANVRHLIHQRNVQIPKLSDLEEASEITIFDIKHTKKGIQKIKRSGV